MSFDGNLADLLSLAETNETEANQAARILMQPWKPVGFPMSFLGQKRWLTQGGRVILPSEPEHKNPSHMSTKPFFYFDPTGARYAVDTPEFFLPNQPTSGIVSVLFGRVPGNNDEAYVRVEAGSTRVPTTNRMPLRTREILYFSAPNSENGHKDTIYLAIRQ